MGGREQVRQFSARVRLHVGSHCDVHTFTAVSRLSLTTPQVGKMSASFRAEYSTKMAMVGVDDSRAKSVCLV